MFCFSVILRCSWPVDEAHVTVALCLRLKLLPSLMFEKHEEDQNYKSFMVSYKDGCILLGCTEYRGKLND